MKRIYEFFRDWKGFASVCGLSYEVINAAAASRNSFVHIIELLMKNENFSLQNLKDALQELERYDIIEDTESLIGM